LENRAAMSCIGHLAQVRDFHQTNGPVPDRSIAQ